MKHETISSKFDAIIESYINGNISWVKAQVKKLSKAARKELFNQAKEVNQETANFFFNLI